MSIPTEAEIGAALTELRESFTYEPPERWISAYRFLDSARREMRNLQFTVSLLSLAFCGAMITPTFGIKAYAERQFFLFFTSLIAVCVVYVVHRLLGRTILPQLRVLGRLEDVQDACRYFRDAAKEAP